MSGLASVVAALALLQVEPPPASPPPAPSETAAAPEQDAAPAPRPRKTPSAAPAATSTSTASPTSTSTASPTSTATPAPTPARAPAPTPAPTATAPRGRADPALDRGEAEKAARAFLDALVARDAAGLAAAASDRFSFDGDVVSGRDAIRSEWRTLLSTRSGPAPRVGSVDLLPAADAVVRFGKPPTRIAPLARPGAWVALADVSGRTVVLFVARENGRMAVLGMHD